MGYEYDIFISYRRFDPDWVRWTEDHFISILRSRLQPALGSVEIFHDRKIETGTAWPPHLAQTLARSRLLVPILCRDYFRSEWCQLELAMMYHREQVAGLRSNVNTRGLIIPVIIDDGDCFPPEVRQIESEKIHQYANPFMRNDSPRREEFSDLLASKLCPAIEGALNHVPPFDPAWEQLSHEQFARTFEIQWQTQSTVPAMSLVRHA